MYFLYMLTRLNTEGPIIIKFIFPLLLFSLPAFEQDNVIDVYDYEFMMER